MWEVTHFLPLQIIISSFTFFKLKPWSTGMPCSHVYHSAAVVWFWLVIISDFFFPIPLDIHKLSPLSSDLPILMILIFVFIISTGGAVMMRKQVGCWPMFSLACQQMQHVTMFHSPYRRLWNDYYPPKKAGTPQRLQTHSSLHFSHICCPMLRAFSSLLPVMKGK